MRLKKLINNNIYLNIYSTINEKKKSLFLFIMRNNGKIASGYPTENCLLLNL